MPVLSVISAYHISLEEFQGRIFLKDQSKRVCLTPLSNRKAAGTRSHVHLATGSWRAAGCFLSQATKKRGRTLSGNCLFACFHQRWVCARENHKPLWLQSKDLRWDQFTFPGKKPRSERVLGCRGASFCCFSWRALVAAHDLPAFSPHVS